MKDDAYQLILDALATLDVPADAKDAFRKLVADTAIAKQSQSHERVQFARHLLDGRAPRPIICQRLMVRFQVGRSQAYRDIGDALQIVPMDWDADRLTSIQ